MVVFNSVFSVLCLHYLSGGVLVKSGHRCCQDAVSGSIKIVLNCAPIKGNFCKLIQHDMELFGNSSLLREE